MKLMQINPVNANQHLEEKTGFIMAKGDSLTQRKEKNKDHSFIVGLDIPYLRAPEFLDAQFSTHQLVEDYFIPLMDYMGAHIAHPEWNDHHGFESFEAAKLKRILVHRLYFNSILRNSSVWRSAKFLTFLLNSFSIAFFSSSNSSYLHFSECN